VWGLCIRQQRLMLPRPFAATKREIRKIHFNYPNVCTVETESGGTRCCTGGEVKGKEANGVGSQQFCTVLEYSLSSITTADAHTSAASSRLN